MKPIYTIIPKFSRFYTSHNFRPVWGEISPLNKSKFNTEASFVTCIEKDDKLTSVHESRLCRSASQTEPIFLRTKINRRKSKVETDKVRIH